MPHPEPPPQDVAATFCATVVDEFVRAQVVQVFLAPGSRSTPMALAFARDERVQLHVFHDERAASFAAVGAALASERPSVVLTTSGTATAELHAAVVEADHARVPMLVLTADRPPELRDVGAPQTIDQQHLYGRAVRWFVDAGVPDWAARGAWRPLAARAVVESTGRMPGPVHVNLPFREPLVGHPVALPPGRARRAPWHRVLDRELPSTTVTLQRGQRGLIVAGRGARAHAGAIKASNWPVLADARSGMHGVVHADALLRVDSVRDLLQPDVIVRVGEPPASRVVNEWLDACDAPQYVVDAPGIDPGRRAIAWADAVEFSPGRSARRWSNAWKHLDAIAAAAIKQQLTRTRGLTEPAVARAVTAAVPGGGRLVVASSMPIRDVEWYAPRRTDITVHANRGANGIDGVVSTAVGAASTGIATMALVGDLAFVHDSTALIALARRTLDLTIVVVDNDGGGIFSFLPQATMLPAGQFESLFGTPHGTDCVALARAHSLPAVEVSTKAALERSLRQARGTRVIVAKSDRAVNVEVHRRLNAAVVAAVTGR